MTEAASEPPHSPQSHKHLNLGEYLPDPDNKIGLKDSDLGEAHQVYRVDQKKLVFCPFMISLKLVIKAIFLLIPLFFGPPCR